MVKSTNGSFFFAVSQKSAFALNYEQMKKPLGLRTWIEVDTKAVKANYDTFRALIPSSTRLMAVVKSNAYGHDIFGFSLLLERLGANWLGVDSITEAVALRKSGIKKPILVLGYTLPERFTEARANNISITISSFESLVAIKKIVSDSTKPFLEPERTRSPRLRKQTLKIHLKIDTGMHRQGFQRKDIPKLISVIKKIKSGVEIEGLYSHFGEADNDKKVEKQRTEFLLIVESLKDKEIKPLCHLAATGGALASEKNHLDMVRIGIGLYGIYPSEKFEKRLGKKIKLSPALVWKSVVSEIKIVEKEEAVGYDFTKRLERESRLAIIPVGYWHGYPRALSNKGFVFIRGLRAPILGRVSMDMLIVDITDVPKAKVGNTVELIGENIKTKEVARLSKTSPYEIVTRLNPLIRRIYK